MPKKTDQAALEARLEALSPHLVALAEAAIRVLTDIRKGRAQVALEPLGHGWVITIHRPKDPPADPA